MDTGSDIKQEIDYIPILDYIGLAFQAEKTLFFSFYQTAAIEQIGIMDNFGADKAPFNIGVNLAGGFDGFGPALDRPGTAFIFTGGEKGD